MQTTIPSRVITGFALPRSAAVTAALVVGFALFTALSAQVAIPLPFTPVPISGQTFAVLLTGAALGSSAGAISMGLYLMLGVVGFPFFTAGASGMEVITGATGGYIVGFILAAWVVGALAERQQDRTVATAVPAFFLGSAIIYMVGLPWLAVVGNFSFAQTLEYGLTPFVIGDLVKIGLAGVLLPTAWKIASLRSR